MRTYLMAILILGLVGAAFMTGANAATGLTGKVVDENGQPVAGARVLSYQLSFLPPVAKLEQETTTADDGSFALAGLPALIGGGMEQARSVIVLAEGHAVGGAMIEGSGPQGPLTLRLSQPVAVSGKVTGPDGKPAAGATVRTLGVMPPTYEAGMEPFVVLWDTAGSATAETDAEGAFTLEGLPASNMLILYVEHPDYAGRMYQGAAAEGLTIALQAAGSIEGQVVLRETKQGIAQAKIFGMADGEEGSWGWATTDEAGRYRLTGLGAGKYQVMVFPAEEGVEWVSTGSREASVVAGQATQLDLEVIRGEVVKGRVVDEETGQPVAGAVVSWGEGGFAPPAAVTTKEDGTFELRAAPGTVDLRVASVPKGYVRPEGQTTVPVEAGKGAEGVELKISRGVTLTGRVVGPNGQAVPQVQVQTQEWQIKATADEKGRFSLDGLTPGQSLWVWASAPERGWAGEAQVEAKKGATEPLTLKLGPAAQVEIRIVDRDGKPLAEPHVSANLILSTPEGLSSHAIGAATRSEKEGAYTVTGLLGGHEYQISASAEEYEYTQTATFTLKAGEKKTLPPLQLRKADAVLTGRVLNASGRPVAGVQVQVNEKTATTDEQGRYRIENLPHKPEAYVRVSHPDYEEDYQYGVNPDDGPVDFMLLPKAKPLPVLAKPGEPAPPLACAYWLNSERLTWRKLRGKVVLLAFLSAGSGPSEDLLPTLKTLHNRYADRGFTVLQVQDRALSLGELRAWVREKGLHYPVAMVQSDLHDGWTSETFQSYGVQAVPALFLIDREGVLHRVESLAGLPEQMVKLLVAEGN